MRRSVEVSFCEIAALYVGAIMSVCFLVLQYGGYCIFWWCHHSEGGFFQNEPKAQWTPCMEVLYTSVHCCKDIMRVCACTVCLLCKVISWCQTVLFGLPQLPQSSPVSLPTLSFVPFSAVFCLFTSFYWATRGLSLPRLPALQLEH